MQTWLRHWGIAKNVMSEIINGKRNITPTMAVKRSNLSDKKKKQLISA
jgi:plasmid maintenance system antidote protein VapI